LSSLSTLPLSKPSAFTPELRFGAAAAAAVLAGPAPSRDRLWDLPANLHCSVIGTCLTAGDLRQMFAKLNQPDARSASDHVLHGRAVLAAGQKDLAAKLLNKLLDKRHEAQIKRFAKARDVDDVRRLWTDSFDRGDIPGAYWAALTHPATDRALVQDVFGEVHMLSHLVGTSNRADIARLRVLEQDLQDARDKIARQEARLRQAAADKGASAARIQALESELRGLQAAAGPMMATDDAALAQRLADEQARAAALAVRLAGQGRALAEGTARIASLEAAETDRQAEIAALEAALAELTAAPDAAPPIDLSGLTLLYVGGRRRLADQLRALTTRRGATFLSHDGGMEEGAALLPALVARADIAFFPVDCVSHLAAGQVKRLCRQAGKTYVPLRSASVACFLTAVADLPRP